MAHAISAMACYDLVRRNGLSHGAMHAWSWPRMSHRPQCMGAQAKQAKPGAGAKQRAERQRHRDRTQGPVEPSPAPISLTHSLTTRSLAHSLTTVPPPTRSTVNHPSPSPSPIPDQTQTTAHCTLHTALSRRLARLTILPPSLPHPHPHTSTCPLLYTLATACTHT